jgi:hypothetical protein
MTASLAPGQRRYLPGEHLQRRPQAPPAPEGGSAGTMIQMKHLAERTMQKGKPTR